MIWKAPILDYKTWQSVEGKLVRKPNKAGVHAICPQDEVTWPETVCGPETIFSYGRLPAIGFQSRSSNRNRGTDDPWSHSWPLESMPGLQPRLLWLIKLVLLLYLHCHCSQNTSPLECFALIMYESNISAALMIYWCNTSPGQGQLGIRYGKNGAIQKMKDLRTGSLGL